MFSHLVFRINMVSLGIPSILIITREILVSGIRSFLAKNNIFDVLTLSKYKTACQMLAIIFALYLHKIYLEIKFYYLGIFFLWISALIALYC